MKNKVSGRIISLTLLICFVFMTGALSGCSENLNDKLVGKWERNWSSEEISSPLLKNGSIVMKGREEIKFESDSESMLLNDTPSNNFFRNVRDKSLYEYQKVCDLVLL